MELEEAIEKVNKLRLDFYDREYKSFYTDDELVDICDSLSTILQYIKYDSIPKKKIEGMLKIRNDIYDDYAKNWRKKDEAFFIAEIEKNILQELLEDK